MSLRTRYSELRGEIQNILTGAMMPSLASCGTVMQVGSTSGAVTAMELAKQLLTASSGGSASPAGAGGGGER